MSGKRLSQAAMRELGIAGESVRFREWDFDRAIWVFRTKVTHRPRGGNSVLTYCGLDWLGNHTVSAEGPATCKRCAAAGEGR